MSDILNKIIATKHDELAALMREKPLSVVRAEAEASCNVGRSKSTRLNSSHG